MNPTRIIFLDIDGVMAPFDAPKVKKKLWFDERSYPFDEKCVRTLNTILKLTDSEIVISSSWRLFYGLEDLGRMFEFNKISKKPIGTTPELGDRNLEIEAYVKQHNIENFLILDDMELTCFPDRFIRTDPYKGLNKTHVEPAYFIFEKLEREL